MKLKAPSTRGWIYAIVAGGIVIALPYVLPMGDVHHGWWDKIPGWWVLFGALGCLAIVVFAKTLGHLFLQKPEDWYD